MDVKFCKHGKTQLNVTRGFIWHLSSLVGLTSDSLNLLLPREILPQGLAVLEVLKGSRRLLVVFASNLKQNV